VSFSIESTLAKLSTKLKLTLLAGCLIMMLRIPISLAEYCSNDESTFTREGIFNTRNSHFYADENPYLEHQ